MPFKCHVFIPICIKTKTKERFGIDKQQRYFATMSTHMIVQTPIQNGDKRANALSVHQRNGFFHQKLGK